MMMRRAILLAATILIVAAATIGGWLIGGNDPAARTIGAFSGFLVSAVICSIAFGFLVVLLDIRKHLRVAVEDTRHIAVALNRITARMDTEFLASIRRRKRRPSRSQGDADTNVVSRRNWKEIPQEIGDTHPTLAPDIDPKRP